MVGSSGCGPWLNIRRCLVPFIDKGVELSYNLDYSGRGYYPHLA